MENLLTGCIPHDEITVGGKVLYRWISAERRTIESYNAVLVPLNDETSAKLTAARESHAIALPESGVEFNGENYLTLATYRTAFRREMALRGYLDA